ncbi:MAG: hypothetical protein ACE5E9_00400 [Nitrospinaceae bacterium]
MAFFSLNNPKDGVSPRIKILVLSLTVLTVFAFGVFFFILAGKIVSPSKEKPWTYKLLAVGEKLQHAGLRKEAIDLYARFLDREKVDLKTRARVSLTIGKLYKELGNCRKGLTWFYQAEAAGPDPSRENILKSQIDTCLKEVRSHKP